MLKHKYSKRAFFPKGEQNKFLLKAIGKVNFSWLLLADKIGVHPRTLNDWKREKYSISLNGFRKICTIAKLESPKNIEIKEPFWYVKKGSRIGALVVLKKYGRIGGDPEYRKKKWREWWERDGKFGNYGPVGKAKQIITPKFSKKLAEFVGIMLGDGGISKSQITVSTNSIDDRVYGYFIRKLIYNNFGVNPSVYFRKDALVMNIVVSRKKLVKFCKEKLELRIGNKLKQKLDIPRWIKGNIEFEKACIRGLIDTDGCVFNERHRIKNKIYSYKRLNFTSYSSELRRSVFNILDKLKLFPKIRNNRAVQIENKEKIIEYFRVIGTNNPKHKKRFIHGGVG